MATRVKPHITTYSGDMRDPVEGVDNLTNPVGVSQANLRDANKDVDVKVTPNNGDQRDVEMPPFANGKDVRSYPATNSSNPTPSKVGA